MNPITRIILTAASAAFVLPLAAQVAFTGAYSENFNSMGTGAAPPTGWSFIGSLSGDNISWATGIAASGTPSAATPGTTNNTLVVNSNAAAATAKSYTNGYNFALSGSTSDRCIGTSPTTKAGNIHQLRLTNDTVGSIGTIKVGYDIRRFTAAGTANELPGYWLFYSTDAGASWTNVTALNPAISGSSGVVVPNTVGVTNVPQTAVTLGTAVAAGAEIRLRWVDDNADQTSPDQIIGLDNVSISLPVVNSPPTVALSAPAAGASYDAPAAITLTADAADGDGTISKVEFFNGVSKLGEATTTPYQFVWNDVFTGSYALTAVVTDNLGSATTSSAVNITVANADNIAPMVTLTAPSNDATVLTSEMVLAVTATDTDGAISKVEFFNGTIKLGEDTSSPYTFNWTGLVNGSYTLTAVATDNDGGITTSAPVSGTVVTPITTTLIAKGAEWKYLDNGSDQGTAWKEPAFDDLSWASGPAVLGGGDTHIVTNVNLGPSGSRYITTYFRRTFNVSGAAAMQILQLNILRDDGVIVYINGTEVVRQNLPADAITFLTDTPDIVSGSDETTYFPATAAPMPVLVNGTNTIAVEVHQRDGASSDLGFDLEMISLALPGDSPTVAITAPADGATLTAPAAIAIAADANDTDGSVAKVEFFNGTTKLGEDLDSPYVLDWTTVGQGVYQITAVATDNSGLQTTSAAVNVTVNPPNTTTPAVSITAPANDADFVAPATVTITADAIDTDGTVTKVEFFNGAAKLGEDSEAPYSFEWTNVPIGDFTLTAKATDDMTATGTSAALVIHVIEDPAPRVTITATDGSAGEYGSDRVLEFTVSRTGLTTGALVVPLVASGTATAGVDYSGFSTSVTIAAGSASLPLPMTILSDDLVEGAENVTLSLGSSPDFVTGSPASANATITDRPAPTAAWRFGVIGDTQQTLNVDSTNNSSAINIISAVNQQFVARNVDMVLAVGDLGDNGSVASLQARLDANAGSISGITGLGSIPFYAVRGNHDDNATAQTFFQGNFIPASNADVTVSLAPDNTSYAVNYKGASFVLLDILATKGTTSLMDQQTVWMNSILGSSGHEHAFVVQHKNLLGQNHKDNAFGSSNDANPTQQNNFFKVLSDNGVRYNISGHDHMNHRAIVASPDGNYKVQQIITQSASTKFYNGTTPYSSREQCVSDEQNKIGFYIYTVEGAKITGEYWATDPVASDIPANPVWTLRDTFGYSLNGKQTTVERDGSYAGITDSTAKAISNGETGYLGTSMSILAGTNTTTGSADGSRAEVDDLNTGWTPKPATLASDVLTLGGMNDALGSTRTDTFTLSLSYSPAASNPQLVSRDGGAWVNAVSGNTGGTSTFAGDRPFNAATDTLGTYGYDSASHTAWAVINHNSDFAVDGDAAPTVAITGPADGASFIVAETITLTAAAADDGSVSKVEFFAGSNKLGEAASAPYACDWSNIPTGSHVLTAVATDNLGLSTTSAAVTITVNLPAVTVAATRASAVEYGPGRTLEFTIARTGPTTDALVIPLVAGGSATAGNDYTGFTGSVTIAAGSASAALTLTALPDSLVEGSETVSISLGTSADFTAGASASATIADSPASGAPWSFGVLADTQWSGSDPTGNNVNSVAVNQIKAVNQQFVAAGVKFVVQVGDLGDNGSTASLQTRLDANSALNDANIPFYGLRGNHEDNAACQTFFNANYLPGTTASATVAVQPGTSNYAVTYNGAKLVLLDILTADSTAAMDSATTWMGAQLAGFDHTQAFVFQHKNLIGQNHKDNAFGGSNDANPAQQNNFISTLQGNGVHYDISGHDHNHYRSVITSPNGSSSVQQLIAGSNSYKYYTPGAPYSSRDNPISSQLGKATYYLFTVDGPRVTVQYYWSTPQASGDVAANPVWILGETFGYSLNGKQATVVRGGSYAGISDDTAKAVSNGETGYQGATMSILAGVNSNTGTAAGSRPQVDDVNTSWAPKSGALVSDVLSLWGMNNALGSAQTDTFTLSLSYDSAATNPMLFTRVGGTWVSAVNGNTGGTRKFVGDRPFNAATDTLGSYGYDSATHTAWAVINSNGDFAVATVSAYAAWAAANASDQAADQDTNHSGVPNGIRYFMGATGSSPIVAPGIVNGAVTWPKSALFSGSYVVEVSSDLTNWEPADRNYAGNIVDSGTSVEFTLPPAAANLFVRLRVVPAP